MQGDQVRIVKGVDGRLTGEAYVHLSGSRAKLRLALAKDRTLMPVSCNPTLYHTANNIAAIQLKSSLCRIGGVQNLQVLVVAVAKAFASAARQCHKALCCCALARLLPAARNSGVMMIAGQQQIPGSVHKQYR